MAPRAPMSRPHALFSTSMSCRVTPARISAWCSFSPLTPHSSIDELAGQPSTRRCSGKPVSGSANVTIVVSAAALLGPLLGPAPNLLP